MKRALLLALALVTNTSVISAQVAAASFAKRYNLVNDPLESSSLALSKPKELVRMMREMVAALHQQNSQYPIDKLGRELKPIMPL